LKNFTLGIQGRACADRSVPPEEGEDKVKATPRKSLAGWTLVVSTVFVLALSAMMMRSPAQAEENLGEHSLVTEIGNYKYITYLYPNLNQAFYLPRNYETRFDIHNSKFWKLEYYEAFGEARAELVPALQMNSPRFVTLNLEVSFYTPRGELIQSYHGLHPNWWLTVPHNRTSLEYDRLQVRVRNYTLHSRDFRIVTMDPVDPVRGTPIPPGRDIHL
jgi:hypothetical protein